MTFLQWIGVIAVAFGTGWLTWELWHWPSGLCAIAVIVTTFSYGNWVVKRDERFK